MEPISREEWEARMTDLKDFLRQEFCEVKAKQDLTNGRVRQSEIDVAVLQSDLKGMLRTAATVAGLVSIIIGLVGLFLK